MKSFDPLNLFDVLFKDGIPPSSPRITPLSSLKGERSKIFTFHELDKLCKLKHLNRLQRAGKYFRELSEDLDKDELASIILEEIGGPYMNPSLRSVVSELPCDLVIVTKRPWNQGDYVSYAQVDFPDAWNAESVIGRSFAEIHENVRKPDGKLLMHRPDNLVRGIVAAKGPFERVGAVVWKQSDVLDCHREHVKPPTFDYEENPNLILRFERQTIVPVPSQHSFMFFIYTYWVNCLEDKYRERVIHAIENAHDGSFSKDFLAEHGEKTLKFLREYK